MRKIFSKVSLVPLSLLNRARFLSTHANGNVSLTAVKNPGVLAIPERGFQPSEYESRLERIQEKMDSLSIDAIVVTQEPDFRYFSGFSCQFWESPTRPWFLVIPSNGKPIACVPLIGEVGVKESWVEDVRTWISPAADGDDGVSVLYDTICEVTARSLERSGRPTANVGFPLGAESALRMPPKDFLHLISRLETFDGSIFPKHRLIDARPIIREIRAIKSESEIEKIKYINAIASNAYERLPSQLQAGMTEREATKTFQLDLLRSGADSTRYLIGRSGLGSYDNIMMGPTDRVMQNGDMLVIDTGTTFDGYFCDFNRNFSFGCPLDEVHFAYEAVRAATDAGIAAAIPGNKASDIFHAISKCLVGKGFYPGTAGRMGHGLGSELTEWPSIMHRIADHDCVLEPGMVFAIEPGVSLNLSSLQRRVEMVDEENVLIRNEGEGAELLSKRSPPQIPVI